MVRAYQAIGARSGTPESGEPQGNGTVMASGKSTSPRCHVWARPSSLASKRNFHGPFRLTHPGRSKSGRGCSGSGMLPWATPAPDSKRVAPSAVDAATRRFIGPVLSSIDLALRRAPAARTRHLGTT